MRILPRPKYTKEAGNQAKYRDYLFAYFEECPELEFTLKLLLPHFPIEICNDITKANLLFQKDNLLAEEEYLISSKENRIECSFSTFLGGRNAIATLIQILYRTKDGISADICEIRDYPDAKFRSFMHDTGRKYIPIPTLRANILLMAKCKFNYLHFHLSEAVGFSIKLERFPELKASGEEQYTEKEIIDLVDYASKLGIEIIPEIDIPGHSNVFTNAWNEIGCKPIDGKKTHGWALCVGSNETYKIIPEIIKEISKLFKSKYIHLGTDEISMRDEMRIPHPHADWHRCSRCRALMSRNGYRSEVELFYHFLNKIYKEVKKLNKTLIIWNDWIDISNNPNIPKDIIIEFWRVAAPSRGPHIGCSMQKFLDEGFNVINANFPDTYIDLYVDYERLANWDYKRSPASDDETPGKIIGADVCAWDVHRHFSHSIPVSIALFAGKLWTRNGDIREDYLKDSSKMILGIDSFSIFDYTNKIIDLSDDRSPLKENIDREKLAGELKNYEPRDEAEKYSVDVYLSYLN